MAVSHVQRKANLPKNPTGNKHALLTAGRGLVPFAAKPLKLYSLNAEKLNLSQIDFCVSKSQKDSMISLIIPTYNRAGVLKRALDSAMNLAFQDYEIIVVDNGSTDATPAIVGDLQNNTGGRTLRYVREERIGLHNARHAGVWAAKGDVLVFTDDDASFAPGWLGAYAQAFEAHPEMVAAGGPVRPSWEAPPPKWLLEFMGDAKTFGILSLMEPYDSFRLAHDGVFFGVNMAIRRDVLLRLGGFNPESFGDIWLGDGETGLNYKMWRQQMLIGYVPQALVYHHIPVERMTLRYFCCRMENQGICDLYSELHHNSSGALNILKRLTRLALRYAQYGAMGLWVNDRTDINALNMQLKAAKAQAQLKYMLKFILDKEFQAFVIKTDWLDEVRTYEQPSATLQDR
jgi:glycosyltransferase involved in cell wall biosynthesis